MQTKVLGRPHRHPDLVFWGCFLLLNVLLFLPFYLLNLDENASVHLLTTLRNTPLTGLFNIFIWRDDADPFRINTELVILLALWVNIGWLRRGIVRWLITIVYFLTLFYYLYESVMLYLYRDEPVFYNHYFLIRDGIKYLAEHLNVPILLYLGVLGGIVIIIAGIILTLRTVVNGQLPGQLSPTSRIMVSALGVAVFLSALGYRGVSADPRMVVSSLSFKLEKNIAASIALYNSIVNFDDADLYQTYNYAGQHLAKKPNIYLLFVESYGSVLYKRPDWRVAYIDKLHEAEDRLDKGGFHYASNLSISPTWGGGSWLAYTSAIFGIHIDSHPQYLAIKDRYQTQVPRYPDLGTYLKSQGYHYSWTTPIEEELSETRWNAYKEFYNADEMLRFSDLAYDGMLYGWGPAPPDQYTLAYTRDVALAKQDGPIVMFYITQNSHFPFQTVPEMVDDWHDLDKVSPTGNPVPIEDVSHELMRQQYLTAVMYDIDMLTDFILNHADEDAVFYLIGDHQPPSVSRRADTYATPVHIISRDPKYIDNLEQFGFTESSLVVDDSVTPTLHHEGMYSLIVNTLIQTYGEHPLLAPPYLPAGAAPPDWINEQADDAPQ